MYAEARRDPQTLLDVAKPGGECEAMLSVAPWEEETVAARYPRLAAKFAPYLQ